MAALFSNNLSGNLNGGITAVATSLALTPGTGGNFPSPTGGDYFLLTLIGLDVGVEASWEIVKVTARATDTLTVVRAQEGTSGFAWLSGTRVELRMTAGQAALFDDTYSKAETDAAVAALVDSAPGTLDTLNELAAALGDDENFATTMTTALAGKVDDAQVLTNVPAGAVFTDTTYSVGDAGLTEKDFTSVLKTKLDGIAASANNYSHPATHAWSEITSTPTTLAGYGITDGGGEFSVSDITGATAFTGSLVATDEFVISDGGVLKRLDMSYVLTFVETYASDFFKGDANNVQSAGYTVFEDGVPLYLGTGGEGQLWSDGADIFLDLGGTHDFIIRDGTTSRFHFRDGGEFNVVTGNIDLDVGAYQVGGVNVTTGFNKFEVVVSLPGTPDSNTIYFVTG
jgi:hypothetical protein